MRSFGLVGVGQISGLVSLSETSSQKKRRSARNAATRSRSSLSPDCGSTARSDVWLCSYASGGYGVQERRVVALVLVGVGLGEGSDGAIEDVGGTEVAGDCDRVAGTRVGAGERPRAQPGVEGHVGRLASRRCRTRSSSPRADGRRGRELEARRGRAARAAIRGRCRSRPASAAGPRPPAAPGWRTQTRRRTARVRKRGASFAWRNSASLESAPSSRITQQRVPTLPTPTTLRARSAYR